MLRRILAVVLATAPLTALGATAASAAPDVVGTVRDVVDFIAGCQPGPDGNLYCH